MNPSSRLALPLWFGPLWFGLSLVCLVLVCLTAPRVILASEERPPKAETILDRFAKATGGKEAYQKLQNRRIKGTLQVGDLKITLTEYQARPNKQYVLLEAEAFGKFENGQDGKVAWAMHPMGGPQLKEGEEKALSLRLGSFDGVLAWREHYKKAECAGIETINGKPCYKIVMTPNDGHAERHYFDKESHLLVKIGASITSETGTSPLQVFWSDYREIDGVLMPFGRRVVSGWQSTVFATDTIEHNIEMPADRFKLPDAIQALVDGPPAAEAESDDPSSDKPSANNAKDAAD